MDSVIKDSWEDSGCVSGNFESSSQASSSSQHGTYTETPTISQNSSRKRKIQFYENEHIRSILDESPVVFPHNVPSSTFLSSTLNESLTKSLENCNLSNSTPNCYAEGVDRDSECEQIYKKFKADSPKYRPATRSEPTTPVKYFDFELCNFIEKSNSENLHVTPKKSNAIVKLGSPERIALLYPSIKIHTASPKLKTPEKLRECLKRINSPAKKKLFGVDKIEKRPYRKLDTDPIVVFIEKNDFRHILSKIFSYLTDRDLCNVSRVSKSWQRALHADYRAFPRFYSFSMKFQSNKENISNVYSTPDSPPGSPNNKDNFYKCIKIARTLLPNQSMKKCIKCMSPAILQKSISQCQNPHCEYIYCINCSSFSLTGPLNFTDKCNSSELVLDLPDKSYDLWETSLNATPSHYNSSGYISDTTPVVRRKLVRKPKAKSSYPFQIHNQREEFVLQSKTRPASLVTVRSPRKLSPVEIIEPPSPPKIKPVTSLKQSKKNLRRLCL